MPEEARHYTMGQETLGENKIKNLGSANKLSMNHFDPLI